MNLRTQIAILLGLLVATATIASGVLMYRATRDEGYKVIDQFLEERGWRVAAVGESFDERPLLREDAPRDRLVDDDSVLTLLDETGATVFTSDESVTLPAPIGPTSELIGEAKLTTATIDGVEYRLRTEVLESGFVSLTARSLDEINSTLDAVRKRLIAISVGITLLAITSGWIAAARLVRPLRRLSESAERITATGNLSIPIDTNSGGEVGQVASNFSEMLGALERSREQQERLVMDASHEFRTPLTTLRTTATMLASGRLSIEDTDQALSMILDEVEELTHLSSELVELASDTAMDEEPEAVDILEIAEAAAYRASRRYAREILVTGESPEIRGRPASLDRAITNLLDNADKFSPAESPIDVVVTRNAIEVHDRGPGIPPNDLELIFDRFYRTPSSRALPGSGLGLAIVAATAAMHGGTPTSRNLREGAAIGFTFSTAS